MNAYIDKKIDVLSLCVPKETKLNEGRAALMPSGVKTLKDSSKRVEVLVQKGAGLKSGFSDEDYKKAGALIVANHKPLWDTGRVIVKVKEPLPEEYAFFRPGQLIFCFQHLEAESNKRLVEAYKTSRAIPLAFEKIIDQEGKRPVLVPMSQIAGRLAIDFGIQYLRSDSGGRGKAIEDATLMILGAAGIVGQSALKKAFLLGVKRIIAVDIKGKKPELPSIGNQIRTATEFYISEENEWKKRLKDVDLLIGAVATRQMGHAPRLLTRQDIKSMGPGSVFVDPSIDQGGCSETSRPSSEAYTQEGVIHLCVPNIPGLVPRTSTPALQEALLPYLIKLVGVILKSHPELPNREELRPFGLCSQGIA